AGLGALTRLNNLQGRNGVNASVVEGKNFSHGIRRFHAGAANTGARHMVTGVSDRRPLPLKGRNDLALTSQRRDKQNRVKTS
ncbi:hypothetical protein, partial [Mycobacterium avium]|uniref:hypothetical protein n=3 Tax=Mycobacterium avium TaxID=1764 RepID=UPI001F29D88A